MEEKVNNIITEIIENRGGSVDVRTLNGATRLREDLDLDSFNLAELTVHIEEEFDVDIFEEGIVNTLGEIYEKLS